MIQGNIQCKEETETSEEKRNITMPCMTFWTKQFCGFVL